MRDPAKRLGVPKDATALNCEDARDALLDEFGKHEASRKSIEEAYDSFLVERVGGDVMTWLIFTF